MADRVAADVVRPLRLEILRPGQPAASAVWPGDDAPGAGHFAVVREGSVVAVGSIVPEPHPVDPRPGDWRVRGMATVPGDRGRGLGADVLAACVDHARAAGARRVWCHARVRAVGVYERAGFAAETATFDVAGLGLHVRLVLPRS